MSALDTVVERAALYGLRSTSDAMLEQAASELSQLRERVARLEAVEALRAKWITELHETDIHDLDDELQQVYRITLNAAITELAAALQQEQP